MTRFSPWLKSECVVVAMRPPPPKDGANNIGASPVQLLGETRLGYSLDGAVEAVAEELRGRIDAQLAHDARAMELDGLDRDFELLGDGVVGLALQDRVQHLPLT